VAGVVVQEDNSRKYREALNTAIARALEEMGLLGERFAKENLSKPKGGHKSGKDPRPNVDTGRLRNSITHAVDEGDRSVAIGTNVEYAPYVELGTSRMQGWPYLRPAATEHRREYERVLRKHMGSS
jgi:HK97 gp10 family phage protein